MRVFQGIRKPPTPPPTVQVEWKLCRHGGTVDLMARSAESLDFIFWYVLRLNPDGTFSRQPDIPGDELPFQLDERDRIKETEL